MYTHTNNRNHIVCSPTSPLHIARITRQSHCRTFMCVCRESFTFTHFKACVQFTVCLSCVLHCHTFEFKIEFIPSHTFTSHAHIVAHPNQLHTRYTHTHTQYGTHTLKCCRCSMSAVCRAVCVRVPHLLLSINSRTGGR